MSGQFWRARNEEQLQSLCKHLAREIPEHGWKITWEAFCPKRSVDQNAISHVWYGQIAKQLREQSEGEVKCECKLHCGVPILRGEDAEFRKVYDMAIKPLTYEQKLEAMKIFPVTSLMSRKQLSRYLEAVQKMYAQLGVRLEFPSEDYSGYREAAA